MKIWERSIKWNWILTKYVCYNSITNSYILPVERNSVYTFIDELSVNNITVGSFDELKQKENRYPGPIKDALETAADLKIIKSKTSIFKGLAEDIEENILHGRLYVSDDGGLQFNSEKVPGISLPIHLTASIIKNISGLLIYLKHQAKANDLLIIDEPEIGLHPDNQILLARILARLVNNGLRVLISTHSDYIIREINNLIMLSSERSSVMKKAKEFGYKEDEKIHFSEVGAYLFDYNTQNNHKVDVVSLPIDESGFEIDTIDKSINLLNEISEELFYSLKYSDDE